MDLENSTSTENSEYRISHFTGSYSSAAAENEYQNMYWTKKIILAQILMVLGLLTIPLIAYFDQFVIATQYYPFSAVAVRVINVIVLLYTAIRLRYIKTNKSYNRLLTFSIGFIFLALFVSELMIDIQHDIYIQFDTIIVIGLLASSVLSAPRMAIIAGIFTLASIATLYMVKDFSLLNRDLNVLAYVFAFLIGYVITLYINFNHRHEYNLHRKLTKQSEELRTFAYRDSLTGLYNRRAYDDQFPKYLDFAARSSNAEEGVFVIVADIDYFKQVNDTYGHDSGDDVLSAFAGLLLSTIRPSDGIYRYGGEEFVIVLSQCPKAIAIQRIQDIIQRLNDREISVHPVKQLITSSFGLTEVLPTDDCDSVTARADELLYSAKEQGRNRLVHD